jgi:hypothetical protein
LAEGLFKQAQCLVKVFIACFVKGCLRQTPSKMEVLILAAREKCRFLRLLKTTDVLAHSQKNILRFYFFRRNTMYKKFLFLTSFVLALSLAYASYADTTPPTPNPMVWHTPPFPSGPSKIIMRARTATDTESLPVSYYFECTTDGTKSSTWQQDVNTYTATGLTPNTTYSFRAKARDSAAPPNETGWSLTLSADTNAITTPLALKLDFGSDSNTENVELGFRPFTLALSGREVNDVNGDKSGVVVDIAGSVPVYDLTASLSAHNLTSPYNTPADTNHEQLYRDSISGFPSTGGITLTLWELGVNRDCNITIYAFDAGVQDGNRIADWNSNGTYLFTTNYLAGMTRWPFKPAHPGDYAWTAKATTDYLGRIVLQSWRDPNSFRSQPYATVNGLVVEPNRSTTVVQTKYAHRPLPFDKLTKVPLTTDLKWTNGGGVVNHDLYFGDDETKVAAATRDIHDVLICELDLAADANKGYDPYDSAGYLEFDKTYYWRVDENPGDYKGEVWSFTTGPNSVVENFEEYPTDETFYAVWHDWHDNTTGASIYRHRSIDDAKFVHNQSSYSMEYDFDNTNSGGYGYYSEAYAAIADLGIDQKWSSIGAKALVLWFYGTLSNPNTEQMYVTLTDGDDPAHTATVEYSGNVNAVREPLWHEWNIDLQDFVDDSPGIDLDDVSTITIGFGDGIGPGDANIGIVYFDDIQLYTTRCALTGRSAAFTKLDFGPGGNPSGDCVIDYQEIQVMASAWLREDSVIATRNPGDANLVVYYALNEGDGNKAYVHPDPLHPDQPDSCNTKWTGTFYNSTMTPPGNQGTAWATPGATGINDENVGGAHCVYISDNNQGNRVNCGIREQAGLGIGLPNDQHPEVVEVNAITVSVWAKWLGTRSSAYLASKSQGLVGKRGGWGEDTVSWMLECDTPPAVAGGPRGSFGLRHYAATDDDRPDCYSPTNILFPYIGQWVHIAATYPNPPNPPQLPNDANAQCRLYLNGAQVNTGPWRFSHGYDPNIVLTIGNTQDACAWGDSPEGFYGYLDEVRIYNRALEPNEISYLADATPEDGYLHVPVQSAAELYTETSNISVNHYTVQVGPDSCSPSGVIGGSSDGYTDGSTYGWYYYPNSKWWNVWFNDQPYNENRYKVAVMQLTLVPTGSPSNAYIIVGGSTGAWDANTYGKVRPPLPGDVNAVTESLYIDRTEPNNVAFNGPITGTTVVNIPIFIWNCNPGWAFIDVQGKNFNITSGYIRHECRAVGEVNFKDFAVITDPNIWLSEEMFPRPR